MNSEELANELVQHVYYEELNGPLLQNYYNVQALLRALSEQNQIIDKQKRIIDEQVQIIAQQTQILVENKKELYNKQRDIDVLTFELANYKPDIDTFDTFDTFDTPDPLTIGDSDEEFI